jgi:hypothetical protein
VRDFLGDASFTTSVWIDIFAVNQHSEICPEQTKADVDAFEDVIKASKLGTIVVFDFGRCNPATRAW